MMMSLASPPNAARLPPLPFMAQVGHSSLTTALATAATGKSTAPRNRLANATAKTAAAEPAQNSDWRQPGIKRRPFLPCLARIQK